jgi:hypothetical protein
VKNGVWRNVFEKRGDSIIRGEIPEARAKITTQNKTKNADRMSIFKRNQSDHLTITPD